MTDTHHDALKPDGAVSIRAGGVHVSVPAAAIAVILTALLSAGATRALVPGGSADTRAQTMALEAFQRELAAVRVEIRGLTETVNRNADAAKEDTRALTQRVDGLYKKP